MASRRSSYDRLKRAADAVCAGIGLVLLSPLFLLIGVLISLDSPGGVFFRQERAGRDGVPFLIYKFRTMRVSTAPTRGAQDENDPRITRVGRWLRRSSLDELPQLINVLRGEMSFIGPRPALLRHVERYDAEQRRRLEVRPGMTGLAQVNGRNTLTWEEKIAYDIQYVEGYSLGLDLRILLRTPKAILDQASVYFRGHGSAWQAPEAKG